LESEPVLSRIVLLEQVLASLQASECKQADQATHVEYKDADQAEQAVHEDLSDEYVDQSLRESGEQVFTQVLCNGCMLITNIMS
jgi:hypothetical protein